MSAMLRAEIYSQKYRYGQCDGARRINIPVKAVNFENYHYFCIMEWCADTKGIY